MPGGVPSWTPRIKNDDPARRATETRMVADHTGAFPARQGDGQPLSASNLGQVRAASKVRPRRVHAYWNTVIPADFEPRPKNHYVPMAPST